MNFSFSMYLLPRAPMKSVAGAYPNSSVYCFSSTRVNGGSSGAPGIGSIQTLVRLRLRPLRLSIDNVKLSILNHGFCDRETVTTRFQPFVTSAVPIIHSAEGSLPSNIGDDKKLAVVAWSAITLVLAIGSRVLQKLALVSMKDYPFFLAQLNSFVYVLQ